MEETKPDVLWLFQQIFLALGLTLLATAVMAFDFTLLSFVIGLIMMACAQKALFDIQVRAGMKALLANEKWNNDIGNWLGARTTFTNADDYSPIYFEIQSENPDRAETRKEKIMTWLKVIFGVSGGRRLLASLSTNLGYAYVSEAGVLVFVDKNQSSRDVLFSNLRDNFLPVLLVQTLIFTAFWIVGAPGAYAIWVLAYLTVFSVTLLDVKVDLQSERLVRVQEYIEDIRSRIPSFSLPKKDTSVEKAEAEESSQEAAEVVEKTYETPVSVAPVDLPEPRQAPASAQEEGARV